MTARGSTPGPGTTIGRAPTAVATGDFDGDGAVDVAWARDAFADFGEEDFQNSVAVSMNLGEGTLDEVRDFPAIEESTDIVAADLDGDDDIDLAVSPGATTCPTTRSIST